MLNILFLLFFAPTTAHQFHVSKSQIEYNQEAQTLQISVHIFLDDLEVAIEEIGGGKNFLCTEKETPEAVAVLQQYLRRHLLVSVDDTPRDYEFLGKELSEDLAAIWCYLEIKNVEAPKNIAVTNRILMDLHDDQKNTVHIIGPQKQQGYFMFEKGNSIETMSF